MGNVGTFMYNVIRLLVALPSKLYEALTYQVSINWLNKILSFFNVELNLPSDISLWAILGTVGGGTLVIIIIYNIFKLWGVYASNNWRLNDDRWV